MKKKVQKRVRSQFFDKSKRTSEAQTDAVKRQERKTFVS
jgi:hypothetical protein